MPRPENPKQDVEEFALLGHKPYNHECCLGTIVACKACHCWIRSQSAANPCGDEDGHTLKRIVVEPKWMYRGKELV